MEVSSIHYFRKDSNILVDISVTSHRKRGEHRKSGIGHSKSVDKFKYPERVDFKRIATLMQKPAGMIYRIAEGGYETKGKPRYHPDWFE